MGISRSKLLCTVGFIDNVVQLGQQASECELFGTFKFGETLLKKIGRHKNVDGSKGAGHDVGTIS